MIDGSQTEHVSTAIDYHQLSLTIMHCLTGA